MDQKETAQLIQSAAETVETRAIEIAAHGTAQLSRLSARRHSTSDHPQDPAGSAANGNLVQHAGLAVVVTEPSPTDRLRSALCERANTKFRLGPMYLGRGRIVGSIYNAGGTPDFLYKAPGIARDDMEARNFQLLNTF
jgi:hypothetical protein